MPKNFEKKTIYGQSEEIQCNASIKKVFSEQLQMMQKYV